MRIDRCRQALRWSGQLRHILYHESLIGQARQHSVTGTLTGHTGPVYSVAFSPNGRTLATASDDKTARLWDIATHKHR